METLFKTLFATLITTIEKNPRVANFKTFRFRFRVATRVAISIRNPGTVVTIRVLIRVSTRVAISICNPETVVSARVSTRVLILI